MAIPVNYDFKYYAGDSYDLVLYPKNEDGSQYNLLNHTGLFTVSLERGNPATDVFSASAQISASPSRILAKISPANGSLLSGASYFYDIEITDLAEPEKVYTFLTGQIQVQQDITAWSTVDYTTVDSGTVSTTEVDVIIDGGIPTSVYYAIFDGGTP